MEFRIIVSGTGTDQYWLEIFKIKNEYSGGLKFDVLLSGHFGSQKYIFVSMCACVCVQRGRGLPYLFVKMCLWEV